MTNKSIAILALTLVLFTFPNQSIARPLSEYQKGLNSLTDGRFKRALIHFYAHIEKHPNDAKAYYYGGQASDRLNDKKRAYILYRRCAMLAPDSKLGKKAKEFLIKAHKKSNPGAYAKKKVAVTRTSSRSRKSTSSNTNSRDTLPNQSRVYFKSRRTQIIISARVNGKPIDMLFDTGAPAAGSFGLNHLKQLGLPQPSTPPVGRMGGASNTKTFPLWMYKADMQVGSIIRKDIPIRVLGRNRSNPLLGQEFFKDYTYTIDYGGKSILFTRNQSQSSYTASSRYSVPFRFRESGNRIVVDLDINGKKVPVMFDTGHTTKAVLSLTGRLQARKFGIKIPANAPTVTTSGASGSGTSRVVQVRRVKLGPIEKYNATIHVSDEEQGPDGLPLLGQAFYHGWQYTIDMNKKLIHFKRR